MFSVENKVFQLRTNVFCLIKKCFQVNKKGVPLRGAPRYQLRSFFEHRSKGVGGGHFLVQKFWSKFFMTLKAFWQHKIDIKSLFKGSNVSNWGKNVKILR